MRYKIDITNLEFYFSEKLAGTLLPEQLSQINRLIENDDLINIRWKEFCKNFNEEDVGGNFSRMDDPSVWKPFPEQLLSALPPKPRSKTVLISKRYMSLYAAAILFAIIFFTNREGLLIPKKVQPVPSITKTEKELVLKLADGREIDLSKLNGGNSVAGILYQSKEKLLSFKKGHTPPGINKLIVPAGLSINLLLSDGTKVMVNSATELSFPFSFEQDKREIKVNGEAYLTVSQDPLKPFVVHTEGGDIQVLGTEFNVNTYEPGHTKVALVSGSVKLVSLKKEMLLKPGISGTINADASIALDYIQTDQVTSWKSGIYYFKNSDVNEISEVLHRWFGVNCVIDRSEVLEEKFTGAINKNEDLTFFLKNIATVSNISYSIDTDHNVHFR